MATELIFLQMEIHFRVCIARANPTVKELINGETVQHIPVSLKTVLNTEKANGEKIRDRTATTTLGPFILI